LINRPRHKAGGPIVLHLHNVRDCAGLGIRDFSRECQGAVICTIRIVVGVVERRLVVPGIGTREQIAQIVVRVRSRDIGRAGYPLAHACDIPSRGHRRRVVNVIGPGEPLVAVSAEPS